MWQLRRRGFISEGGVSENGATGSAAVRVVRSNVAWISGLESRAAFGPLAGAREFFTTLATDSLTLTDSIPRMPRPIGRCVRPLKLLVTWNLSEGLFPGPFRRGSVLPYGGFASVPVYGPTALGVHAPSGSRSLS